MSDVPLGLFLSGGIDSSGLAALMAPMVGEPIRTFAVGFGDPEANELAYARYDSNSLAPGHVIVVPRRHVADFFDMTDAEQASVLASGALTMASSAARWRGSAG